MNFEFIVKKIVWQKDSPLIRLHFTLGAEKTVSMYHSRYFMNYPCIHKMFTIDLTTRVME